MPRERQLFLGGEDSRWHPVGRWLELGHDQLELPHLCSECYQRLSPKPRRASEKHDQSIAGERHTSKHVDMTKVERDGHANTVSLAGRPGEPLVGSGSRWACP